MPKLSAAEINELVANAKATIDRTSEPFDTTKTMVGLGQLMPGREQLGLAVVCVAVNFLLGANVGESEAALVHVLAHTFNPQGKWPTGAPSQLRGLYQRFTAAPSVVQAFPKAAAALPTILIPLEFYDTQRGTRYAGQVRLMLFGIANAVAKADGTVSPDEQRRLLEFKTLIESSQLSLMLTANPHLSTAPTQPLVKQTTAPSMTRPVDDILRALESLIGLASVKTEVANLVNYLKVEQLRRDKGMPTVSVSRHLVFFGNPGTGKTTIARLIAELYRALGVLEAGQLVETDRAGMVGGFVGQTALKTAEIVDRALGGYSS